jgi:glycosyltransferase involved in cell wall biosynthesis
VRILIALTYYRPHVSGLTIYAERLAKAMVARGHAVTVLTSQHRKDLPRDEMVDGVRVVRVPVAFMVSKGPIMPGLPKAAARLIGEHDVVSVHLPMFEAGMFSLLGKLRKKPVVLTYHCDLILPPGIFNQVVNQSVFAANWVAAKLSNRIVAYTHDYASHSRILRRFKRRITVIPPPVVMPSPSRADVEWFRRAHGLGGKVVLGFASRFAAEKGIEYLVHAMPELMAEYPNLKVLFAGPYEDVIGEDAYRARLGPEVDALGDHWEFLGTLGPDELPAFYGSLDCLLMTSVNSTESFGLVQVEAMLCGTPVVATNLPGVRQPVTMTGMGEVVAIADSAALAEGIRQVLGHRERYFWTRAEIEEVFDIDKTVAAYERLFTDLQAGQGNPTTVGLDAAS